MFWLKLAVHTARNVDADRNDIVELAPNKAIVLKKDTKMVSLDAIAICVPVEEVSDEKELRSMVISGADKAEWGVSTGENGEVVSHNVLLKAGGAIFAKRSIKVVIRTPHRALAPVRFYHRKGGLEFDY